MCQDEEAGSGDCRRAAFEAQLLPCNAAKLSLPILLAGYGGIHFVTESGVILQNEDGVYDLLSTVPQYCCHLHGNMNHVVIRTVRNCIHRSLDTTT